PKSKESGFSLVDTEWVGLANRRHAEGSGAAFDTQGRDLTGQALAIEVIDFNLAGHGALQKEPLIVRRPGGALTPLPRRGLSHEFQAGPRDAEYLQDAVSIEIGRIWRGVRAVQQNHSKIVSVLRKRHMFGRDSNIDRMHHRVRFEVD